MFNFEKAHAFDFFNPALWEKILDFLLRTHPNEVYEYLFCCYHYKKCEQTTVYVMTDQQLNILLDKIMSAGAAALFRTTMECMTSLYTDGITGIKESRFFCLRFNPAVPLNQENLQLRLLNLDPDSPWYFFNRNLPASCYNYDTIGEAAKNTVLTNLFKASIDRLIDLQINPHKGITPLDKFRGRAIKLLYFSLPYYKKRIKYCHETANSCKFKSLLRAICPLLKKFSY